MDETVLLNEALPAGERFAWWCELTERMPAPTRFSSEHADDFRAGVRCLDFGAVHVATLFYPPLTARRGPAQIRRADPERYHLLLNLAGSLHYAQCGRQVTAAVGDLVLGDSSHPCEARVTIAAQPARTLVVQLPRAEVRLPADRVERLLAVRLPGEDPLAALVADHLNGLLAGARAWASRDVARLGRVTIDLITGLLAHRLDARGALPPENRRRLLLEQVHAFIDANLGEPELSPRTVADAMHISVRYLHRLFQQDGDTVCAWIKQRRLERCRRDLAEPLLSDRPVYAIAARWGLAHPAEFSRIFHSAYGIPPGEYRTAALRVPQPMGPAERGRAVRAPSTPVR